MSEIAAAIDMARSSGATAVNVMAFAQCCMPDFELLDDRVYLHLRWPAIYQWPELAEAGGFAALRPAFYLPASYHKGWPD